MWYKNLFQDSDNIRYVADLSNTYCHLPRSGWEHIKRLDPETRITFIMRDPVQRTLSHLKFDMMFSGLTSRMESVSDNEVLRFATSKAAYDRSDYAKTISEITRVFPNQQFRYYYFEEIMSDKEQFCKDLSEFLGIKLTYHEGLSQSVNEGPQKKFSKNLVAKVREAYAPIYRDLETFLGPLPSSWNY